MLMGALFAIVAAFYASVGFGGGSSYLALLVLWELPYAVIPAIALICNITVVSGNSIHYARAGYINWRLFLPPTIASIPMAYLGGSLQIEKELFVWLLFATLLISGIRLLVQHRQHDETPQSYRTIPLWFGGTIGAVLGFLAGLVGIGGGIFLAPILYNLRAGSPKHIAATASLFILVNSISGLIGQLQKSVTVEILIDYWHLPLLVFAGGQLGNILSIKLLPPRIVALLTGILVLFVATRLAINILT